MAEGEGAVGECTGATPLVFSIIGDLFSVENRVHVAVIPGMSMGIGQLVGQAMAGYIGDKYNWCAAEYDCTVVSRLALLLPCPP
jgi:MFS family permease